MEGCWIFMVPSCRHAAHSAVPRRKSRSCWKIMCSCFNEGLLDVAAHGLEELLGLECWSLTALVQEEVALLEKLHHWILVGGEGARAEGAG
ncbi:hypothetical protein NC652_029511 [Populus alba x Populus x berolinensis]|uniref:Uncharacterized protein n=1 Tax=Populus alba x Populus x berolinensis TaxID=444605 RepID=A0AAD6Q2W4_9ROSI|nr:hypothetical protein NC652_029507 [Populus alba x Populus x berolinensis]KAJ6888462.1 hypothetical protein NC652_029511 [Populus alba x Populus x berolinensis]KAJ6976369.1 hypothetical protein NC653_028482 [Populus alba x Populus x berolinensis]KAJ6977241.1 hypothetical protein NC653_029215 [Populus alba x Populus x berolinensis]KAJ6977244.1 hypothetical protein NC653_029218 [Populus alba x Populus x berolinensis]